MALPAQDLPFTASDYLAWEAEQPEKHEYLAGAVFAMGGAARNHVTVSLNLASALADCIEGGPCRAYMADMKVEVAAANAFFHPDVLVTCDPDGRWFLVDIARDAPLTLTSLGLEIPWARIFRNVDAPGAR